MKILKTIIFPIFIATSWISISEFLRNQVMFPNYWVEHYHGLGLEFPSSPINGAIWGLWSLVFAGVLYVLSLRFSWKETALIGWFLGFVMMWLVIGNLGVLPLPLLIFAVPLSVLEVSVASFILHFFRKKMV